MVNKILAEFGVPVDELPGGVITMHDVMFYYMLLYFFLSKIIHAHQIIKKVLQDFLLTLIKKHSP